MIKLKLEIEISKEDYKIIVEKGMKKDIFSIPKLFSRKKFIMYSCSLFEVANERSNGEINLICVEDGQQ